MSVDPLAPYPSVEDVTVYVATMRPTASWAELTPEAQAAARASSELQFDLLCWQGDKADLEQPHAWPRTADDVCCGQSLDGTEMPMAIDAAFCELTLALAATPTLIFGKPVTTPPGLYVSDQRLEGLGQSFAAFPAGAGNRYGAGAPVLFQRLPWIGQMLECWVVGSWGTARVLSRC